MAPLWVIMCDEEDEVVEVEVDLGPQRGPKSVAAINAEIRLLRRLLEEFVDRPIV